MKNQFLIVFFLLLASNFSSQSKIETVDWINNKIGQGNKRSFYWGDIYTTLKVSYDGTFKVFQEWEVNNKHFDETKRNKRIAYVYSGNFKNISLNEIKLKKENNLLLIEIYCLNAASCIKSPKEKPTDAEFINSQTIAQIYSNNDELGTRGVKAIQHLITLLGGQKDAF